MRHFTFRGILQGFGRNQRNVRVTNTAEARQFWTDNNIDTRLDWAGNPPLATVSRRDLINRARIGDMVEYVIEYVDRRNGRRGVRGIDLRTV
jgi:hypothetical protein